MKFVFAITLLNLACVNAQTNSYAAPPQAYGPDQPANILPALVNAAAENSYGPPAAPPAVDSIPTSIAAKIVSPNAYASPYQSSVPALLQQKVDSSAAQKNAYGPPVTPPLATAVISPSPTVDSISDSIAAKVVVPTNPPTGSQNAYKRKKCVVKSKTTAPASTAIATDATATSPPYSSASQATSTATQSNGLIAQDKKVSSSSSVDGSVKMIFSITLVVLALIN